MKHGNVFVTVMAFFSRASQRALSGDGKSWYARLWGGETGIDPYTRVVSNIYQDVFAEGSYIGKGIYDVDAFEKALAGRLPENRILSHDLIEGCYARSGLLSDVQLYEEYPSQYSMDVSRRHRWIRGDWQIASWLRSVVPTAGGSHQKNKISWLSQWKIFDNLRRSLVPAALTLMLIMGWTIMSPVWLWTIMVIGILLIPSACAILLELFRKPGDVLLRQHFVTALRQAGRNFFQTLYTLICLPYEAFFSLDAIARTLWRMLVSHKRLLEWNPSGNQTSHSSNSLAASCRSMWIAPFLSAVLFIYLTAVKTWRSERCFACAGSLVSISRNYLVGQQAYCSWRYKTERWANHFSKKNGPQNLGILRNIRRAGRSLAAT